MSDGREISRNLRSGFLPVRNLGLEMRMQDTHNFAGSSDRVGSSAAPAYISVSGDGILYKPAGPDLVDPLRSEGLVVAAIAVRIAQDLSNQIRRCCGGVTKSRAR